MTKWISRLVIFVFLAAAVLNSRTEIKAQQSADLLTYYFPMVSQTWRTSWVGPNGGRIAALAVDPGNPDTVYAGSFGAGVQKSVDGGETWFSVNTGLPSLNINALAVDPVNSLVLYAGPYEHKLYKSVDGGLTWMPASEGLQEKAIVYSIAIDPQNPANVYISTRGINTSNKAPWKGVVYKSRDAGASWSTSLAEIGGSDQEDWVYSLAINPDSPNVIFAASHQHGPYRSDDYGKNWKSVDSGIGDGSGREIVIVPHTSNPGVEYYGEWHGAGVFKSKDDGNSWLPRNSGVENTKIFRMVIDPLHTSTVYAAAPNNGNNVGGGIYKTENGGVEWRRAGMDNRTTYVIGINRNNPDVLITGTLTDGIWKTSDAGAGWYQTGLRTTVTSVLAFPGNANSLVVSTNNDGGVSISTDQGKSWSKLNTGLGSSLISGLVMNPANPNQVFALTEDAGLYRIDLSSGTGWVRAASLLLNPRPAAVPPAGVASDRAPTGEPVLPGDPGTLEGPVETLGIESAPLTMAFSPANPDYAYVGTSSNGVFAVQITPEPGRSPVWVARKS